MQAARDRAAVRSWFRTRGGRRFGIEFALIVVVKLFLLTLLWFVCFRPHPRPDTSPDAIERHLLAPSETSHDR
ncbi:MAG TPA: hypothetical protein VHC92_03440 [Rhodanobacteraceae bacterium]|jgi:hypothetical protein|nr:hypothetical protein [Rhodanobacteraceae bacterium]